MIFSEPIDKVLLHAVRSHPHPLLFVTISGAHLYGFPSADSDYDLRGAHVLPARAVLALEPPGETCEIARTQDGLELDFVTHDARKFFTMLLKHNGLVLEHIYSPLILFARPEFDELREIARGCITKHHTHHYLNFAALQWKLFCKSNKVKQLVYLYRVLLTGIHLMRTGEVEPNLQRLNEVFRLRHVNELIACKMAGPEISVLTDSEKAFHESEYCRLRIELMDATKLTDLPDEPSGYDALNDLLLRLRLG
ncbi:MAG TPA: nucleotidyltransferase domain-containing protein [Planctomycetota bacterium]|nr:nucleotidyltransferase domain-containing protein [Planctomycetota bacterium]